MASFTSVFTVSSSSPIILCSPYDCMRCCSHKVDYIYQDTGLACESCCTAKVQCERAVEIETKPDSGSNSIETDSQVISLDQNTSSMSEESSWKLDSYTWSQNWTLPAETTDFWVGQDVSGWVSL